MYAALPAVPRFLLETTSGSSVLLLSSTVAIGEVELEEAETDSLEKTLGPSCSADSVGVGLDVTAGRDSPEAGGGS